MEPILITGCARSGIATMTGILQACGMHYGEAPGEWIVGKYMRSLGVNPTGLLPLPKELPPRPWLREDVEVAVRESGWEGASYGVRDARIALTWKMWAKAFPRAKWIITIRDKACIIKSCKAQRMRLKGMGEWNAWFTHYDRTFKSIRKCAKAVSFVPMMNAVDGDRTNAKNVIESCGLVWNEEEVDKYLDSSLWNYR